MGLSDIATPIYQNTNEESSLMTSDMSQVTEIFECNDSADWMPKKNFQEKDNMETSTHDKSSDLSFGEKSKQTSMPVNHNGDINIESTHKQNHYTQTAQPFTIE